MTVGNFLSECVVPGKWVTLGELFLAYRDWCDRSGVTTRERLEKGSLEMSGFSRQVPYPRRGGWATNRYVVGIVLRPEWPPATKITEETHMAEKLTQGEIIDAPNPRPAKKVRERLPAEGFTSLADLQAAQREKARAVNVTDAQLAEWHVTQAATLSEHRRKLRAACEANEKMLGGLEDPNWNRWWLLSARYRYVDDALAILERVGHVLVCPSCGIDGVPGETILEGVSNAADLHPKD